MLVLVLRPRGMRLAPVVIAALLAAACGSGHSTVTGTLRMTGGPSGATQPGVPGKVVFQTGSERVVVTAATDGAFSAALPPGRYEVTGSSPLYGSGQGVCRTDTPVVVASSSVAGVIVACSRR